MSWFPLSVGCAFFIATTAALSKLLLKKDNIFFVAWVRFLFFLPLIWLLHYILRPGFALAPGFWRVVLILLPLELIAFLIYLKALEISPLSLTVPFLGFTPAFAVLSSYILLREKPNPFGLNGVALVSIGAYLLNFNVIKNGINTWCNK